MKWTTRLLFLLAVSLAAAVIAMVSGQRNRTPESSLDSIAATIERDDFNHDTLLRSLDGALSESRSSGEQALQIRALTLRGDLLLGLGAAESARADYEEIRSLQGTADEALLLRLVETDVLAGDPDSGQRRIEALLSINPSSTKAHVQHGRLYLSSAKQRLDECLEILREVLMHDEALIANQLVDELAAQDLLDPHRAGTVSALRALFSHADSERLTRVLVHCDAASLFSRKARESFEASFAHGTDSVGVYEYIVLLMKADQDEKAMRFGVQIRTRADIAAHHQTSLQLIRAHLKAGDGDGAGTLAAELIQSTRDLTPREYGDCCRALVEGERWSGLFHAASRMHTIGTPEDALEASLYLGFAQKGRKRFSNARTLLRTFATSNTPAPYPSAYYEAWLTLAELDNAAGDVFFERESIHSALQLNPDGPRSSQLWVRLGELQIESGHADLMIPLSSYAKAICRSPKGYEKIYQRFEEIGAEAIDIEGRDLEMIYQDLLRERRSLPPGPLDAYTLLHLARRHATDNNYYAVMSVCRRLLDNHPGFLPATDLMIDARLKLGRVRSATELIVERIDTVGLDKTSRTFIQRLSPNPYSTAQLHRVMRADPARTGRLELAKKMRSEGHRRKALTFLEQTDGDGAASSDIAFFSAQIQAELARRAAALETLSQIKPGDPHYSSALLLTAKVASLSGNLEAIDSASAALQAQGDVDDLRQLADQLLFDRRIQKASRVLTTLQELSGENNPWHLDHSILFHVVQGDVRKTREAAARAEAFSSSPLAPLGLVLASTIAVEPAKLRDESTFLLDQFHQFSSGPDLDWKRKIEGQVGEAILALFAGDPERGIALLTRATQREGFLPEWALVFVGAQALGYEVGEHDWSEEELSHARLLIHGSPKEPRDPHTALGVLLAAQSSHYAPYALEKLNLFTDGERSAWDAYLIAKTLLTGGEELRARNTLWSWVQPDSEYFPPAWDMFEQIELLRLGNLDRPEFDSLHLARLRCRAKTAPQGIERKLVRSYDALDAGDLDTASRAARSAHELEPTSHWTNATLARVLSATGEHSAALSHWNTACENAPASHRERYVTGALDDINRSLSAPGTTVLPSVTAGALETLAEFSPEDPRIPLALAHIDLHQDPDNPALGVAHAFRRMENFLKKVGDVGLADLHPGTESDWITFYLQYGPERGLELCRSQLALSPGAHALWLGEVRALRALGRHDEALLTATDVLQMGFSAQLYEETAASLQATGATPKQVEAQLIKAKEMSGELSVGAMLTRTKSLLGVKGERTAGQAIAVLSRVWDPKTTGPLSDRDSEVGLLLSEGFMKRGKARDYRQAKFLLTQVSERAQDPYNRSLATALTGLCVQETP